MTISIEVLEAEALKLPNEQRSGLADRLLASLESGPQWRAAWDAEAGQREHRIARGEAEWIALEDVMARLRSSLG